MSTITKAQRWGGSISAPIPAPIAKRLRISAGTPIEVEERNGAVIITPQSSRPRRTLAQMLAACKGNSRGGILMVK